jgi:hypothetical protein
MKTKERDIYYFLNSYTPICTSKKGRLAVDTFSISPFVDASCRREPDLEHKWPSITATCRPPFVRRLRKGDKVVYITKKGSYLNMENGWRLTAILEVIEIFEVHKQAAKWYNAKKCRLPYNCIVKENSPLPEKHTAQMYRKKAWPYATDYEKAEAHYQEKIKKCGIFVITKPIARNLKTPPVLTEKIMLSIFGREPGTQNPPRITEKEFNDLVHIIVTDTIRNNEKNKKGKRK